MKKKLIAGAIGAAAVAAAVSLAPSANATPASFFSELAYQGMVVWDYPGMLQTGYTVCALLWEDINPYPWLTYTVGYTSQDASSIMRASSGCAPVMR